MFFSSVRSSCSCSAGLVPINCEVLFYLLFRQYYIWYSSQCHTHTQAHKSPYFPPVILHFQDNVDDDCDHVSLTWIFKMEVCISCRIVKWSPAPWFANFVRSSSDLSTCSAHFEQLMTFSPRECTHSAHWHTHIRRMGDIFCSYHPCFCCLRRRLDGPVSSGNLII